MRNEYSLKVKLIVSIWMVLIFSLAVPSNYFIQSMEDEAARQYLGHIQEKLRIVDWIVSREPQAYLSPHLDDLLKGLDFLNEERISILNDQGKIIADSRLVPQELKKTPSLINNPEIVQARIQGMGYYPGSDHTGGLEMTNLAVRINSLEDGRNYYLRISTPRSGVHAFFEHISANLWKFVFLSLLLSCIVVYLVITYLTYRLKPMISMAQSMGQGNFRQRIKDSPGREFDPLVEAVNRMADDVEKNVELVSRQKSDLEVIVNGIKDGLAALDNQGRIVSFNRSFQKIFKHLDNLQNKRPLDIFLNAQLQNACDAILKNPREQTLSMEMEIRGFYYDVHLVAPSNQRTIGAIILLHDITALKRLESIRKDFVANASHELRTPLTSIKGYTETLLQNPDIMEQKGPDLLKIVVRNTDNMIRLLDDILQLSRIESIQDKIILEDIDLKQIIIKSWNNCEHYILDKHIRFRTELLEGEHLIVRAEQDYLQHVFQNLFENSIKYVPRQGLIRVLIRDKGKMLWIGIEDNGPGIPESEQQRIFERFYRIRKDRNKVKGTGLGLAICRNILKALGGEIWVESPVSGSDYGCIIWFSLNKSELHPKPGRQTDMNA